MKKIFLLLFSLAVLFGCRLTTQLPKTGFIVCINFDDASSSVYHEALPLMSQYGFRGTAFANSGYIGQTNRLTWGQLDSLYTKYHWEIGGHTFKHDMLSSLTYAEAESAISRDYDTLNSHGYHPVSFATPYGYCPINFYPLILKYYRNIRTCFDLGMRAPVDRSVVGSYVVLNYFSAEDILNRVRRGSLEQENLIVLLFHKISTSDTSYLDNCTPDTFAQVMKGLHELGVKVLPLNEALDELDD